MTRIIVVVDTRTTTTCTVEDPRSRRELVKAINTGKLIAGKLQLNLKRGTPQWATSQPPLDAVTVRLRRPPVELSPRMYDVLYCVADGLTPVQIAYRLKLSRRTVYLYLKTLRQRFDAVNLNALVSRAYQEGILSE